MRPPLLLEAGFPAAGSAVVAIGARSEGILEPRDAIGLPVGLGQPPLDEGIHVLRREEPAVELVVLPRCVDAARAEGHTYQDSVNFDGTVAADASRLTCLVVDDGRLAIPPPHHVEAARMERLGAAVGGEVAGRLIAVVGECVDRLLFLALLRELLPELLQERSHLRQRQLEAAVGLSTDAERRRVVFAGGQASTRFRVELLTDSDIRFEAEGVSFEPGYHFDHVGRGRIHHLAHEAGQLLVRERLIYDAEGVWRHRLFGQ